MAQLRYIDDNGQLQIRALDSEAVVIGRAASCQIVLVSEMISREHARIEESSEGRYIVRDLGSRNKTHVAGQMIAETFLQHGDVVRCGDRVVEFLDESQSADKLDMEFLTPDKREPVGSEWHKIKVPVSLTMTQIEELSRLSTGFRVTARPEDIAETALATIILEHGAERGMIALRGESKREIRPIAHRGLQHATRSIMPVSQTFVLSALLQSVAGRYPTTGSEVDPKSGFAAVGMVAPLSYRGEVIGLIYVDRPATKRPFPAGAVQKLAATGATLGALMAEASQRINTQATGEGAAWMHTVRRVQKALSAQPPELETYDIRLKQYHGRARCGDFIDVIPIDEQRTAVLAVDAGGHGMTGTAQASAVRAAVRTALSLAEDSFADQALMFNSINALMASWPARQLVSCTFLAINLASGKVSYINAGGIPPVLLTAPGRLVTLDQPSLVLGVDAQYDYEMSSVEVPEKFRLVCYSDGFSEATNSGGEALGNNRIHDALLEQDAYDSADAVVAKLTKLWEAHLPGSEGDDDATMLVMSRG